MTLNTPRNPTTADTHRARILEIIALKPNTPITGLEMADLLGISAVHYRRLKDQLIARGQLIQIGTLTGPGGGTVFALPSNDRA